MLILNDGYTFLRYDPAFNTVTVTELSRSDSQNTTRQTMLLPDFLAAITPDQSDED